MSLYDHLDALNDIALQVESAAEKEIERKVKAYCEENDLDESGFAVTVGEFGVAVDIAE